jgi:hypothetical protein
MTPTEFFAKWRAERDRFGRYRQLVDPLPVLDELLADVQALLDTDGDSLLNLTQAGAESGYSADYLGRLVKNGTIPNAGRPNAPLIRRADLPRKAGTLRPSPRGGHYRDASPGQVARAVVTSNAGERR